MTLKVSIRLHFDDKSHKFLYERISRVVYFEHYYQTFNMPSKEDSKILGKVADVLKSQDDLTHLETIIESLDKEKSSIDSQIKLEQERGMNEIQGMINHMQTANKQLKLLETNIQKLKDIQKASTSDRNVSSVFDKAATTLKNFLDIEELYTGFRTLAQKMDLIEELMTIEVPKDAEYYSETSSGDNLLLIHYELTQLWDFKDKVEAMAERSTPDVKHAAESSFKRLDNLIARFNKILRMVIDAFVDIMNCENYGLIIKLIQIIQFEEKEDMKLRLLESIIKSEPSGDVDSSQKVNKLHMYVKRTHTRDYRNKFDEYFEKAIKDALDNVFSSSERAEILQILDDNYYETLGLYSTIIKRCFPPEWNYFLKVVQWNQKGLRKLFLDVLDDDSASNNTVVQMLNFEYENRKKLKELFNMSKSDIKICSILDKEKMGELLESCLNFNKKKTTEWIDNSLSPAIKLFKSREKEPPDTKEEKLGIETAQTMIEILRSNINALADLGDSKILVQYLVFFGEDVLKQYYDKWNTALSQEVKKWTLPADSVNNQVEEDTTVGFMPRYITILANDCVKLVDALEGQFKEVKKFLHSNFHEQVEKIAQGASAYAIELGTNCLQRLNGFIVVEYQPYLEQVFSKDWYKSSSMIEYSLEIVEESYMGPLEEFLHPELYISLFEIVFDQYLLSYLSALFYKHKIKEPKFSEKIERDGNLIQQTFSKFDRAEIVPDQLYILDILINLSNCQDSSEYVEQWKSAVQVFNDLPLCFVKIILRNKGLSENKTNITADMCKGASKEVAASNGEDQASTFMARFHDITEDK